MNKLEKLIIERFGEPIDDFMIENNPLIDQTSSTTPVGWEDVIEKMKTNDEIVDPKKLANSLQKKGFKPRSK